MAWNDLKRPAAGIAALLIAALPAAALAETLVVRSSGPSAKSYPAGKALSASSRIVLRANDQLVLLDGRGTRTLKGPGTFSTAAAETTASDSRSTFAALVTQRSERRARIGAVRGISTKETAANPAAGRVPNIWYVDVERSTNVCVSTPNNVTLWRPGTSLGETMTVTAADGTASAITWTQGQAAKAWPATLPIVEGSEYRLTSTGMKATTTLKFTMLERDPQGLEEMAATLIKRGCDAQLDLLIETVAVPGSRDGGKS